MSNSIRTVLAVFACASAGCSTTSTPAPNEFSLISSYCFNDTCRNIASYEFVARTAAEVTLDEPVDSLGAPDDIVLDGFFEIWLATDESASDPASEPADSFTVTWLEGPEHERIVWEWLPEEGESTACVRNEIQSDSTEIVGASSSIACIAAALDDLGLSAIIGRPTTIGQEFNVPLLFDPSHFEYVEEGPDDALPEQVDLGPFDVFESDGARVEVDQTGGVRALNTWVDGVLWTLTLRV